MENVYVINENEDLIKIKQNWGIVKPIVVLYSGMYRTFDAVFETHHLNVLKQITNNDLDSCIVGMHTWEKDGESDNPEQPNEAILKNIKNIKYTKTNDPCNYIKTDRYHYPSTIDNNYRKVFMERWSYSMNIALKNAKEIYLRIYGIEMPENQPILRLRYDTIFMQIQQNPFPYPLLNEEILPLNEYFYFSHNNTARPYNKDIKEVGDLFFYSNKKTVEKMIEKYNHNFVYIDRLSPDFIEHTFYNWLKYHDIKYYSDDVKPNLCR